MLPAKKCLACFSHNDELFDLKNTVSYNTRLLVLFFEMNLFFCRLEKNLKTEAVLFSSQFFPIPRVLVVKKPLLPERIFYSFIFYSLCISFSTVQRCADCKAVRQTR